MNSYLEQRNVINNFIKNYTLTYQQMNQQKKYKEFMLNY